MSITNITQSQLDSQATSHEACTLCNRKEFIIDLTDAIADITENIIHDSGYSDLPSDIFVDAVKRAINDLVDDFALDPHKYLQPKHFKQIDTIAHEYLNS